MYLYIYNYIYNYIYICVCIWMMFEWLFAFSPSISWKSVELATLGLRVSASRHFRMLPGHRVSGIWIITWDDKSPWKHQRPSQNRLMEQNYRTCVSFPNLSLKTTKQAMDEHQIYHYSPIWQNTTKTPRHQNEGNAHDVVVAQGPVEGAQVCLEAAAMVMLPITSNFGRHFLAQLHVKL